MSIKRTTVEERKALPLASGVLDYFPDALLVVAEVSRVGNEQHHPGEPLHWDKSKSADEADALLRHLVDRGTFDTDGLRHTGKVAWRALALLQRELDAEAQVNGKAIEEAWAPAVAAVRSYTDVINEVTEFSSDVIQAHAGQHIDLDEAMFLLGFGSEETPVPAWTEFWGDGDGELYVYGVDLASGPDRTVLLHTAPSYYDEGSDAPDLDVTMRGVWPPDTRVAGLLTCCGASEHPIDCPQWR